MTNVRVLIDKTTSKAYCYTSPAIFFSLFLVPQSFFPYPSISLSLTPSIIPSGTFASLLCVWVCYFSISFCLSAPRFTNTLYPSLCVYHFSVLLSQPFFRSPTSLSFGPWSLSCITNPSQVSKASRFCLAVPNVRALPPASLWPVCVCLCPLACVLLNLTTPSHRGTCC